MLGTNKDADKSKSTDNADSKLQLALGGAPKSDVPERVSVLREAQVRYSVTAPHVQRLSTVLKNDFDELQSTIA